MTRRVLCVDDDPSILVALESALTKLPDVAVDVAKNPAEARERMQAAEYAVLISDQSMPGETGLSLLTELAKRDAPVVRIMLTGHADLELSLEAINSGHVFALLEKPVQATELLVTVRSALEKFESDRQLHEKIDALQRANTELSVRNHELTTANEEVRRLEHIAATDLKTGAASYRFFVNRLEEEIARSRRYRRPLSLLLVDLDGFKDINDHHGHLAGDGVLRQVADMLRAGVRVMDVLGRYGGDEFGLILPDTDLPGAATLAERLRVRVGDTAMSPARPGELTLSVGVVALPHHDAASGVEMIDLADKAMYRAKASGRNCCVIHERLSS